MDMLKFEFRFNRMGRFQQSGCFNISTQDRLDLSWNYLFSASSVFSLGFENVSDYIGLENLRWLTGQRTWLRKWLKLIELCTTATNKIKGARFQVTFRKYRLNFPSQNLKYMYNSARYTLKNRLKNEKMRTKEKMDQ